jgi:cytidine deaminase
MDNQELFLMAKNASNNAYSPYSNIKVGAALLAANDKIYTGCNVENSSYGATICAERTAFLKAISEGEREFVKIAIGGSIRNLVPCGMCRQFMSEFGMDLGIIYENEDGELVETTLAALFPSEFKL